MKRQRKSKKYGRRRRYKGKGILDTALRIGKKIFTSETVRNKAKDIAKDIGKKLIQTGIEEGSKRLIAKPSDNIPTKIAKDIAREQLDKHTKPTFVSRMPTVKHRVGPSRKRRTTIRRYR